MSKQPDKKTIEEVALLMALSPTYVEKDWYVTQILAALGYVHYKDYTLVFTGGTALSKGHKLIKRVSEDLDFRVIMNKKKQTRKMLSEFKNFIVKTLTEIDLNIQIKQVKARNENQFFAIEIGYKSQFDRNLTLRPHIQIEISVRAMQLEPVYCTISSFINEMIKETPEVNQIACADPVENAADKLSAISWRIPDRVRNNVYDDPSIVRHIHDLAILSEIALKGEEFKALVLNAMENDKNRSKVNMAYAVQTLQDRFSNMIYILKTDKLYQKEYKQFVEAMSYAIPNAVPSYDLALKSIEKLIQNIT